MSSVSTLPTCAQGPEFARYASSCFAEQKDFLAGVGALMHQIHTEFRYDPAVTTISTPLSEVFVHKGGVCQDFAHLMIACIRSLGVAARYVSGYLVPGPDVIGAQASHAWISTYCPGMGWMGFRSDQRCVAIGEPHYRGMGSRLL